MALEKQAWEKILRYLRIRDKERTDLLDDLLPQDLAEQIYSLPNQEKIEIFGLLNNEEAAIILGEMELEQQAKIISLLSPKIAADILSEMPYDDMTDLLGELKEDLKNKILGYMQSDDAEEVRELLEYPKDSAGGIMTTEFIAFKETLTVREAIKGLRELAPSAETAYYIYVIDEDERLVGVVSLRELIIADENEILREIMRTNVVSVEAETDQEQVAQMVQKYNFLAIPVTDKDNKLLGIITVDDIMDVIEEETTEDIYHLVGTSEVEGTTLVEARPFSIARTRLPWLIICLLGGLFSGSVISVYEETLDAIVTLAFFIPVIMDMGGNVGSQSSTVFVRGVATGEIPPNKMFKYFLKEIKVGLIMGIICGITIALAASLWQGMPILGLVVGISMFCTVTLAATIGTLIPLIFTRFGIDPAVTAGPFVTTIKDVTGLMIYFYIATAFMDYLM
ncbi:magnesium transporter [Anaerobranca gottschalkii]|uniref:Magnesium transporter MgtE n=1 Tax=Anaerobranca gottschalkii DSM 13577 TaxID=1120990 RepID=A0A1H9ZKG4_9FIRM|nr:magnesium transporter [Anaerobranca gottschalkii]SES82112.1 magnesium transporter [Anaerobranca gottschalkii DSM 13577]